MDLDMPPEDAHDGCMTDSPRSHYHFDPVTGAPVEDDIFEAPYGGTTSLPDACPEPGGQEVAGSMTDGTNITLISMHELMLDMQGQCPWCGEEEG